MSEKISLKIVLLGNSGVGKTSLVNRWINGSHNKTITPTVGANHQKKTLVIDGQQLDLFIWDTAGQEQFLALAPLYTRSASVAIMTASIVDEDSFSNLNTWKKLLEESCESFPPVILAVNKIDLSTDSMPTRDEIEESNIDSYSSVFFVSAQTGEGVDELFIQAGRLGLSFHNNGQCVSNNTVTPKLERKEIDYCC